MHYEHVVSGTFLRRENRFIAYVDVEGTDQVVHVKNTGRCRELLLPGAEVWLEAAKRLGRKTPFSLIAVRKGERLINIDSQAPNTVVFEALSSGLLKDIGEIRSVKREVTFGKSRFDLYYESERERGFIEVKGVTLEEEGLAMFPDAPTERGTKHVYEMMDAVKEGYGGTIFFLIQMKDVKAFTPNRAMDPAFAEALWKARDSGVNILAYDSVILPNEIQMGERVLILPENG